MGSMKMKKSKAYITANTAKSNPYMNTIKNNTSGIHRLCLYMVIVFTLLMGVEITAQSISGPRDVDQNTTYRYQINGVNTLGYTVWKAPAGSISYLSGNPSNSAEVDIRWNTIGTTSVQVDFQSEYGWRSIKMFLSVNSARPASPPTPTISNVGCGESTLYRAGTLPSDVTWYWQGKNSSGTSTSQGSGNSFTANEGTGRYYLRAKHTNGNWSNESSSVYVQIQDLPWTPSAPTSIIENCGETVLTRGTPPPFYPNITLYWQNEASGTETLATNAAATITKTSGNVIYLRSRDNNTGCWSAARAVHYNVKEMVLIPQVAHTVSNQCEKTILTRGTDPSGANVTWYWQDTRDGTETANAATTITKTSGSVVYLRSKHNTSGCWGSSKEILYSIDITTWYKDADGDGFATSKVTQCESPGSEYVQTVLPLTDCNDTDASIHPNTVWYNDSDGDGFGYRAIKKTQCTQPVGYVANAADQCTSIAGSVAGCEEQLYENVPLTSTENYVFTRLYQKAMSAPTQIKKEADVIENITYFDGLGRAKQQRGIKSSGLMSLEHIENALSVDWTLGQGSTPFFNQNGRTSENNRVMGVTPAGKLDILWKCGNDTESNADGGWNTNYITVDKNIGYRYTVWVKRTGSNSGSTFHGTQNVNNLDGSANSNPYFWNGDLPQLDTWYLLVGVIHPHQYTRGNSGITGVYDLNGNKVLDGTDFKWRTTTTTASFRNYLFYSTDVNTNQFFWNPVVQSLNGKETSIAALISAAQQKIEDVVTHIEYDQYGRQNKEYLPFTADDKGAYKEVNVTNDINTHYKNTYPDDFSGVELSQVNAYSESDYEASPLNRVLKQAAPGKDWKLGSGHEIEFTYETNNVNEVRLFEVSFTDGDTENPSLTGGTNFHAKETLYKTITYDENHTSGNDHSTEEFKNKQGQIVLKRTYNNSSTSSGGGALGIGGNHDTYYIYDDYGNLTFVIPPKVDTTNGVSQEELDELCYQYRYDHRNRLIEKKIPGKGWEYIVYNKLDQPVLTQDALLKQASQWLFTKYDALGRVAYTGKMSILNKTRLQLQQEVNDFSENLWVTKSNATTIGGVSMYYTDGGYPKVTAAEVLTINYYDNYDFLGTTPAELANPNTVYGEPTSDRTKSLVTATLVKVLETNDWITTVTYYDKKGRPVYVAIKNDYLSTADSVESKLDFAGKVQETKTTHTKDSNAAIVTIDKFTYDHMGRVLTQTQTINNSDEELIAANSYDRLGQLMSKKVGGSSSTEVTRSAGLQTVSYDYNVRGWLTGINESNTLGNDLFAFKIDYNTATNPLYNGNIAKTSWQTANDHVNRHYTYSYDALNRITGAISNDGKYNLSNVTYDKAGNILSLDRKGHLNDAASAFGEMDKLVYNYSHNEVSNKLLKVTDNTTNTFGFKDGNKTGDDFEYDVNGNLTIDRNKGIDQITYNHLNLPTTVTVSGANNGTIQYVYDATGAKLKKVATEGGNATTTEYANGYIYKEGNLEYFSTAEGYVTPENGGYKYIYQFKDHLQNVRLSYTDANNDGTIDPNTEIISEKNYYPFGLTHQGYNRNVSSLGNSTAQLQGFGSFEEQKELGLAWLDFTARNYDPAIGRWMNLDPLAEAMRRHSPYNYAFDNPVFYVDPDGMMPFSSNNPKTNYSKTKTTGTVNYKTTIPHAGRGGRYRETTYRSGKIPGTTVSSHNHTIVKSAAYKNFNGTSITNSSTSKNPQLGLLADITGAVDPSQISHTAQTTKKTVSGQYFDGEGNKVDSMSDAAKLVVNTTTVTESVNLESDDLRSANVETTTTQSTSSYDIITVGEHGTKELVNESTTSNSTMENVNFDDASDELKTHAINRSQNNSSVQSEIIESFKQGTEKALDEIKNN